jgi:hypothetical protein
MTKYLYSVQPSINTARSTPNTKCQTLYLSKKSPYPDEIQLFICHGDDVNNFLFAREVVAQHSEFLNKIKAMYR